MCRPGDGVVVSEGNHTLGFGETEGVGVGTVVVCVVASLAIMAVLACWTVPDGVGGLELFTESKP